MSLSGKVTLITGASRGIGRAIALALAEAGSDLILLARPSPALEEAQGACAAKGVQAKLLPVDLRDPARLEDELAGHIRDLPRVDHLINNAGVTRDGLLMRMKRADWDEVLTVNLSAPFLLTRAVVPHMIRSRFGRIVNISSVVGLMGNAGQANYCASKAGLLGFTYSMARELASRNITVNAITPGLIETEMTAAMADKAREELIKQVPMRRMGTAQEVAAGVLFLLSEGGAYVTGTHLNMSGGLHIG